MRLQRSARSIPEPLFRPETAWALLAAAGRCSDRRGQVPEPCSFCNPLLNRGWRSEVRYLPAAVKGPIIHVADDDEATPGRCNGHRIRACVSAQRIAQGSHHGRGQRFEPALVLRRPFDRRAIGRVVGGERLGPEGGGQAAELEEWRQPRRVDSSILTTSRSRGPSRHDSALQTVNGPLAGSSSQLRSWPRLRRAPGPARLRSDSGGPPKYVPR
jgi:hypothetical protein